MQPWSVFGQVPEFTSDGLLGSLYQSTRESDELHNIFVRHL